MASWQTEPEPYKPVDVLSAATQGAAFTGAAGLTMAAAQNALQADNVGAWHVFKIGRRLIPCTVAMGAVFEFSRFAAANLREKYDWKNHALGGALSGAVFSFVYPKPSFPLLLGHAGVWGLLMGAYHASGGLYPEHDPNPEFDKYEVREAQRQKFREPIENTIDYVGLGRGIRPPGYAEMRKRILEERYGVKIQTYSANPDDHEEGKDD